MTELDSSLREDFSDIDDPAIRVVLRDSFVGISRTDVENGGHFQAYVLDQARATVNFSIKTMAPDGQRDPFFRTHRASDLGIRAIRYFEGFQNIDGIDFSWASPILRVDRRSDNYSKYISTRDALRNELPEREARIGGALATWTVQRIAIPAGFSKITEVKESGPLIAGQPANVSGTVWRA